MNRSIIIDPALLESLQGQQFLILRPSAAIATRFDEAQHDLLLRLPAVVTSPNIGHLTLHSFRAPAHIDQLRAAARAWAETQQPFELTADALDVFPVPWKIGFVRLERSEPVLAAYESAASFFAPLELSSADRRASEDWIPHLSLAYGAALADSEWDARTAGWARLLDDRPSETIVEAELIWFDAGEHREVIPLGTRPKLSTQLGSPIGATPR